MEYLRATLRITLVRTHNIATRVDWDTAVSIVLDSGQQFLVEGFPNDPHIVKAVALSA